MFVCNLKQSALHVVNVPFLSFVHLLQAEICLRKVKRQTSCRSLIFYYLVLCQNLNNSIPSKCVN